MGGKTNPYDEAYYQAHCGPIPCDRSHPEWLESFGRIAGSIVRELRPGRVLDVGCAKGFLVESLWDRGVEAYGIDVSEVAIAAVRPDIRPFCRVASATDPIEGRYDLVACIETLEHLSEPESLQALQNIAGCTDTILFSSTPSDLDEPTHCNVRPLRGWIVLFEELGFLPDPGFDACFVAPHAMLFRRSSSFNAADILQLYVRGILRTIEVVNLKGQLAHATAQARVDLSAPQVGLHDEGGALASPVGESQADKLDALRAAVGALVRQSEIRDRAEEARRGEVLALRAEIERETGENLAATREALVLLRKRLRRLETEYLGILSSRTWRATRAVRSILGRLRASGGAR